MTAKIPGTVPGGAFERMAAEHEASRDTVERAASAFRGSLGGVKPAIVASVIAAQATDRQTAVLERIAIALERIAAGARV